MYLQEICTYALFTGDADPEQKSQGLAPGEPKKLETKKAWKLKKAKAWHPNVDSKKPHQLHPVVIIILNLSRRDLVLVDKSAFWAGIQWSNASNMKQISKSLPDIYSFPSQISLKVKADDLQFFCSSQERQSVVFVEGGGLGVQRVGLWWPSIPRNTCIPTISMPRYPTLCFILSLFYFTWNICIPTISIVSFVWR